jgi:3-oxoadipate enol-lactonase
MPFLDRNGVTIHWDEQGEGTPLLLIMGLKYSSAMWYPVIPSHSSQHRVIWFDNRGTGQSTCAPSTTIGELAQDAQAVLDAAGVDSAHVYGVSMGGGIAMELALEAPERVRSLILGCTAIKTEPTARIKAIQYAILKRLPSSLMTAVARKSYGTAASKEAVTRDLAILKAETFDWDGVRAQANAVADYSVNKAHIAALQLPTLIFHGTTDKTVPYASGQKIAATIPGARLVTFENIGHNYLVGAAGTANAESLAFLAHVDARTADPLVRPAPR